MRAFSINIIAKIQEKLINSLYCIGDILKVIIFSGFKTAIYKSKENSEIIVVGNGPSAADFLNSFYYSNSKAETLVMNFFATDEWFFKIKPKYYVFADPQVFNSDKIPLIVEDKYKALIETLSRVSWEIYFIIPRHFKNSLFLTDLNNLGFQGKVITYNNTPLKSTGYVLNKLMELGLGITTPESVIISSIAISINLGYGKVTLIGVEHSWVKEIEVDTQNRVSYTLRHFYKGDKVYPSPYTMSEFMSSQHRLFLSHEKIAQYAQFKGVTVVNLTKNSLIDAYERH